MSSDAAVPSHATPHLRQGRERRAARRLRVAGALAKVLLDVGTDVVSVSRGGMTILFPRPLPPGSIHEFCLVIGPSTVELAGAVRNSVTLATGTGLHRIGIEFKGVTPEARAVLEAFLGSRLERVPAAGGAGNNGHR